MTFCKRYILGSLFVWITVWGIAGDQIPPSAQRRFSYFYLEAVRQRNLGNYAQAHELYKHALLINPNAPEALFEMASFTSVLGSREETQRYYEKAVELSPDNLWYLQVLGNFYYRNNELDRAISVYEKMAEHAKDSSDSYYNLLSLYTQKKDWEKCIWVLNKVESMDGKSEQISMEKYHMYLRMEQKEKAFSEIEALAKEYANDPRYKVQLGDLYLDNNQPEKAWDIYQAVLKEDPQNTAAQLSVVSYLEKTGKTDEANQKLETLVLNPQLDTHNRVSVMRKIIYADESAKADSTHVLGLLDQIMQLPQDGSEMAMLNTQYKVMKKMPQEEIISSLRQVVRLDPSNTGARLQLLQYAIQREDFTDAIQICQEAMNYTQEELIFCYYMGLSYYQQKKFDEALEVFRKSVGYITSDTDPSMASDIYGAMGDIYHDKDMNELAYAAYDKALELKPDNVQVLNNYAYYLALQKKDLEKAEAMSFRTVKADPKAYNELDTYAWILFLEKKYTEAKIYIESSLKNGGDVHSGIVEHAGDIFYFNGELTQALEYWKKAEELGSDSKTLKKKIKQKKYIEK